MAIKLPRITNGRSKHNCTSRHFERELTIDLHYENKNENHSYLRRVLNHMFDPTKECSLGKHGEDDVSPGDKLELQMNKTDGMGF